MTALSSAIRWHSLERSLGDARPKALGGDRRSFRIEAHATLILALIDETPDMTLEELKAALKDRGVTMGYGTLWRFFERHGITRKKRRRTPASRTAGPGGYGVRGDFAQVLSAFADGAPVDRDALAFLTLALTGAAKLRDQAGLLEFSEGACDLAHGLLHRVGRVGEVIAGCGDDANAKVDKGQNAQLLRHEIASEAAGILDDHDANAVAFDPVEQLIEAGPRLDWIGAAHGRIIKPIIGRDLEAGAFRIGCDRLALTMKGAATALRPTTAAAAASGGQLFACSLRCLSMFWRWRPALLQMSERGIVS